MHILLYCAHCGRGKPVSRSSRCYLGTLFLCLYLVTIASTSASANTHWQLCMNVGAARGLYDYGNCRAMGVYHEYNWVELRPGVRSPVVLGHEVSNNFIIRTSGVEAKCTGFSGTGWVENPNGGGDGIDLLSGTWSGCTAITPAGCTVPNFSATNVSTKLKIVGGSRADILENLRLNLVFSKCESEKTLELSGELGAVLGEFGELTFTSPPEEGEVKLGEEAATLTGEIDETAESKEEAVRAVDETTLLAEWLANGSAVVAALAFEMTNETLLEDTTTAVGKVAVLCSYILDGTVDSNGEGSVEKVLNLAKEEIGVLGSLSLLGTGSGSDCVTVTGCAEGSAASPIEVWVKGLPWATLLFLEEAQNGTFAELITGEGYELLCLVIGINAEDSCESAGSEFMVLNDPVSGGASIPPGEAGLPLAKCTQSGKETGVFETDASAAITLTNGELLTVSSE
jgi:hypothetical protein